MPCSDRSRRSLLHHSACLLTAAAFHLSIDVTAFPVSFVTAEIMGTERRYPVPAADGANIDRSAQVILVRAGRYVYAMALACPHENAAVKWLAKDRRFQCSKHDSRYAPDGVHTEGRATRNLDRFPIRLEGTMVVVAIDRVYRSDQDDTAWRAAHVELSA